MKRILALLFLLFASALLAGEPFAEGKILASLMDPAKLATLAPNGANTRVQKITGWLASGKQAGRPPEPQIDFALDRVGWKGTEKGKQTREAILRNLSIAERLAALSPEGIAKMKRGEASIVQVGPYKGQLLSVDHIIPLSVVPELGNVLANLELMPLGLNQKKGNGIGQRQRDLAKKLNAAGLLSSEGAAAVAAAKSGNR